MVRNRSHREKRSAFTLIELLVVIAIIAILVSLTAAAVMKVMGKIPEVTTRTEISQFDTALADFMATYNLSKPPPSYLIIHEDGKWNMSNQAEVASLNFLKQCFGKNLAYTGTIDWNGDGTITSGGIHLQGQHCLTFYLGGIPASPAGPNGCTGFSTSPYNPALASGDRKGPFYEFKANRLHRDPSNNFFVYVDAWHPKTNPLAKPYAFFSTQGIMNGYNLYTSSAGGDCAGIGASPYLDGINSATKQPIYTFNTKYQIISAGQNGIFGSGVWINGAQGAGADDQANFAPSLLVAGQR